MEENKTTIQVTREAAEELKRRFPHLRNDAVRISVLLGIIKIEELPRPEGAQAVPVITIAEA